MKVSPVDETSRDRARETGPALEAHYRFLLWFVPAVERFPRSQKFLLGDRIRSTALDVLEALVEATYTKRRQAHLAHANLGLEKLRFRNRLRGLRDRWRRGTVTRLEVERRVGAWIAHAEHANTWRLRRAIFRDGSFDPSREPDHPPAGGFCGAVPGTTNRGTCAPRTATGTTPETGTTTTGSELPARSLARTGRPTGRPGVRWSVQGRS